MLFFQLIEVPASDLQLAGSLPASVAMFSRDLQIAGSVSAAVAMLAIFQLVEVPASWRSLAGSLTASVAMLASDLQLTGCLPASVAMLASDLHNFGKNGLEIEVWIRFVAKSDALDCTEFLHENVSQCFATKTSPGSCSKSRFLSEDTVSTYLDLSSCCSGNFYFLRFSHEAKMLQQTAPQCGGGALRRQTEGLALLLERTECQCIHVFVGRISIQRYQFCFLSEFLSERSGIHGGHARLWRTPQRNARACLETLREKRRAAKGQDKGI